MNPFNRPKVKKGRRARPACISKIIVNRHSTAIDRRYEINPLRSVGGESETILIENVVHNLKIRGGTPHADSRSVDLVRNGVVGNDPIR